MAKKARYIKQEEDLADLKLARDLALLLNRDPTPFELAIARIAPPPALRK